MAAASPCRDLRKTLEKMERCCGAGEDRRGGDLVSYSKSDFEFHACIYAAA